MYIISDLFVSMCVAQVGPRTLNITYQYSVDVRKSCRLIKDSAACHFQFLPYDGISYITILHWEYEVVVLLVFSESFMALLWLSFTEQEQNQTYNRNPVIGLNIPFISNFFDIINSKTKLLHQICTSLLSEPYLILKHTSLVVLESLV